MQRLQDLLFPKNVSWGGNHISRMLSQDVFGVGLHGILAYSD
jgi:hypothetical protein